MTTGLHGGAWIAQGILAVLLALGASVLRSNAVVSPGVLVGVGSALLVASGVALVVCSERDDGGTHRSLK